MILTSSPRFRGPAHATGMGKILLAFGGEQTFRDFVGSYQQFKRFTPRHDRFAGGTETRTRERGRAGLRHLRPGMRPELPLHRGAGKKEARAGSGRAEHFQHPGEIFRRIHAVAAPKLFTAAETIGREILD